MSYETLKHSPIDSLNSIEQEFLIRWFLYHMGAEERLQLMHEHPVIYNKLCGTEIMVVKKREVA